jgi:phosphopantothenoylcysteine decarboxylase/phosphopantothenate--cysteine ligase
MAHILLGVSASAACFKAAALASTLAGRGHQVQVVLTPSAAKLVTPLQFSCLTGRRALISEFDGEGMDPAGMDHIRLAREADLLVIVPASANLLGQLAHGLAPHLLATLALALEQQKPRLLAPAMNPAMWAQPAVARNVATLEGDGWQFLGPAAGHTACGEDGEGRLMEVPELAAAIEAALGAAS